MRKEEEDEVDGLGRQKTGSFKATVCGKSLGRYSQ